MIDYLRSLSLIQVLVLLVIILFAAILLYAIFSTRWHLLYKVAAFLGVNTLYFTTNYFWFSYPINWHVIYLIPSTLLALLMLLATKKREPKTKKDSIWTVEFLTEKGKVLIDNIKRGMVIFGSAGSGKTESVFVALIKHFAERKVPVLVYDYKDLELTEIVNYFYAEAGLPIYTLIPNEPTLTDRFNPFHPDLVPTVELLENQVNVLYRNLSDPNVKASNPYFDDATRSALIGTLWRLKDDFPSFCTLPHATALCLNSDPFKLADFIKQNPIARMKGGAYLDAAAAKETLSNVKSTMSTKLNKIASPTVFWLLSGHDFDPRINNINCPAVINIVNNPKLESVYGPFVSLMQGSIINAMQVRDQEPSALLFDEATTSRLDGFPKIPATMRSYNIATIIGTQDRAMANLYYTEKETDALLSNLSYQIIGKANENKSIKYYKDIAEEIEKKVISKSYKDSFLSHGDNRRTESVKDSSKYKNQDFRSLKAGEFLFFSDGEDQLVKLKLLPYERVKPKVKHFVTQVDLDDHMQVIIEQSLHLMGYRNEAEMT